MLTALLLTATLISEPTAKPQPKAPVDTVQAIDYLKRVDDVVKKAFERGDYDEDDVAVERQHLRFKTIKNGAHIYPTYFVTELNPLRDWC